MLWNDEKFSLTKKKYNSLNQLFRIFFSKTVDFTKLLSEKCQRISTIWRYFSWNQLTAVQITINLQYHSVEKWNIYWYLKKIRQINALVFSLVKTLLSRNFCQSRVTVNFPYLKISSNWLTVYLRTIRLHGIVFCKNSYRMIIGTQHWFHEKWFQ